MMTSLAEIRQRALSRRADEKIIMTQAVIDAAHKNAEQNGLFYQMGLDFLTCDLVSLDPTEIAPILSVVEIDCWHGESNRKGQVLVEFALSVVDGFPITFNLWARNSLRQPAGFCGKMTLGPHFWFVRGFHGDVFQFQLLGDAILKAEELVLEAAEIAEAEAGYLAEMEAGNE